MPDGGKLTVETGNAHLDDSYAASVRGLAPGQYACICMTDTGAGMYACKASVDLFGMEKDDFIDQVESIITVGEFYEIAAGGEIIFT